MMNVKGSGHCLFCTNVVLLRLSLVTEEINGHKSGFQANN